MAPKHREHLNLLCDIGDLAGLLIDSSAAPFRPLILRSVDFWSETTASSCSAWPSWWK